MEMHYIWWIAAAALAVVEMTTGSLYLLVIAAAAAAAGTLAWFGFDLSSQWACAVAVGMIGPLSLYQYKKRCASAQPKLSNNLDIGRIVDVLAWNADGSARVHYRGTQWDARLQDPSAARGAQMLIAGSESATFLLAPLTD